MSTPTIEGRLRARLACLREHLGHVFEGHEESVLYSFDISESFDVLESAHGIGRRLSDVWRHRAYLLATRSWHTGRERVAGTNGSEARWRIDGARWKDHKPAGGVSFNNMIVTLDAGELDALREQMSGDAGEIAAGIERRLRARGSIGPEHLPYRLTIAEGLALVDAGAEKLVADTAAEIVEILEACPVPSKLHKAILAREGLVNRWPWPRHGHRPGAVLCALVALADSLPAEEHLPGTWPGEVAPLDVARWVAPVVKKHNQSPERLKELEEYRLIGMPEELEESQLILEMAQASHAQFVNETRWVSCVAVVFAALQDVERGQKRQALAIDAGQYHHEFLVAWRDLPKDRESHKYPTNAGRIELFSPGKSVQLALDLGAYTISEALISALRQHRKWEGLRHWAAIQRLLSVEGGRAGWVRWTLDDHLNALGVSPKERTRAAVRANAARQVEAFTKLELAAYNKNGTLRERRPLLIVGAKYDRLHGSEWELDGMELQINPLLYSGVREENGRLGSNWHPAPTELARVDHVRHPYALFLALVLPIRWRLALGDGKDHITLSGESALRLAGIKHQKHDPKKAWDALDRNLEELRRIGGLGRWEWDANDTPRSIKGRLHLWPAPWILDRTHHEVRPLELPPGPSVLTGAELKAWRKSRNFTQAQAADHLGVHRTTIARAEIAAAESLPPALADKLRQARVAALL